jgi:hypothetical protein
MRGTQRVPDAEVVDDVLQGFEMAPAQQAHDEVGRGVEERAVDRPGLGLDQHVVGVFVEGRAGLDDKDVALFGVEFREHRPPGVAAAGLVPHPRQERDLDARVLRDRRCRRRCKAHRRAALEEITTLHARRGRAQESTSRSDQHPFLPWSHRVRFEFFLFMLLYILISPVNSPVAAGEAEREARSGPQREKAVQFRRSPVSASKRWQWSEGTRIAIGSPIAALKYLSARTVTVARPAAPPPASRRPEAPANTAAPWRCPPGLPPPHPRRGIPT